MDISAADSLPNPHNEHHIDGTDKLYVNHYVYSVITHTLTTYTNKITSMLYI